METLEARQLLTAAVSGVIWIDSNGDGVRNSGDFGGAGWMAYCDQNGNNVLDSGEPAANGASDGSYTISGLAAGTYAVRARVGSGFRQFLPGGAASHVVTLADGETATGKDFMLQMAVGVTGSIRGRVVLDANGDGVAQTGEAGMVDRKVFIDRDRNGKLGSGDTVAVTDVSGYYRFDNLQPGVWQVYHDLSDGGFKTAGVTAAGNPGVARTEVYGGQTTNAFDLLATPFTKTRDLDPTFAVSGRYGPVVGRTVNSMTAVSGGKFLVSGSQSAGYLYRFDADGVLDPTFASSGRLMLPYDLGFWRPDLVTTDGLGRILVGDGYAGIAKTRVLRLLPDGKVDTTFGTSGVATMTLPGGGSLYKIIGLPDGRVLMLCQDSVANSSGSSTTFVHVLRLTATGQLDPTFAGDGDFTFEEFPDYAPSDMAVDSAGRVVVSGLYRFGAQAPVLARLTASGVRDESFNGSGVVTAGLPGKGWGKVLIDGADRVVIAAATTSGIAVGRRLADGRVDASFGSAASNVVTFTRGDGRTPVDFPQPDHVAFAPDGSIVVVGEVDSVVRFKYEIAIARFRPDGGLDATFAEGGRLVAAVSEQTDLLKGVAVQADGRIVVPASVDGSFALLGFDPVVATAGGSISGTLFDDRNKNGKLDATELPLAGYTVYVDANNDRTMQPTERVARTNGLGGFAFTNLPAGTYSLRVAPQGDYRQTAPAGEQAFVVTLAAGQQVVGVTLGAADVIAPSVTAISFDYRSNPSAIRLTFSEDVSASFTPGAWRLESRDMSGNYGRYIQTSFAWTYDRSNNTAAVTLVDSPEFPAGRYRFTLRVGADPVRDGAGNYLAGNVVLDFFHLPADADRDGKVEFSDLLILARNYGTAEGATYDQGDFTYDGRVDFADLLLLAKSYRRTLPAPLPLAGQVPAAAASSSVLGVDDEARPSVFSASPVIRPEPAKAVARAVRR